MMFFAPQENTEKQLNLLELKSSILHSSEATADQIDTISYVKALAGCELAEVIKQFGPDVAITFSSPEGSRVAFGLGIRHIGFNDSPHAEAVAKLTIPLTSKLYCPWVIPHSAWSGYGIARKNIVHYRALDPAWLKHHDHDNDIPEVMQDKKDDPSSTRGKQGIIHCRQEG